MFNNSITSVFNTLSCLPIPYTYFHRSKSIKFSAISANDSSDSDTYCCHTSSSHISSRFETPIIVQALCKVAYVRKDCGILILPCLSISHSDAPERKKRVNL